MSQVATATFPPVTDVYSGASLITVIATMVPTAVNLVSLGQQDVVLPHLTMRYTLRGYFGLSTVLQQ